METKKFQGPRMVSLCAVYLFAVNGMLGCWTIAYGAYWPDFYGVGMTPLGFGTTVNGVMGLIAGFMAVDVIIRKLGARKMLLIATGCEVCAMLLWALVPELWGYYLGWAFMGIVTASIFPTVTHVVVQWYYDKRQKMIGLAMGAGTIGMFVTQAISGFTFPAFGVSGGFLLYAAIAGVVGFSSALFIADSPAAFGQQALGHEKDPDRNVPAGSAKGADEGLKKALSTLYRTPSFWLLVVAFFLMANGPSTVSAYASYYLPMFGGFTVSEAATFVSLSSLGKAVLLTFVIGALVSKLHAKNTLIICSLCTIAAFALLYVYVVVSPSTTVLVPMYFTFILGFCISNLSNYITPDLYGTRLSTAVNVKLQAITKCAALYVGPLGAYTLDTLGFAQVPVVLGTVFTVGFVLSIVAFGVYAKKDKAKLAAAIDAEGGAATVEGAL